MIIGIIALVIFIRRVKKNGLRSTLLDSEGIYP